jgi:hypothetical protein
MILTLLLLAVCLIAFVALRAVQAGRDLRAHANTVAHLDCGHLGANFDCRPNDLCLPPLS